MAPTKINEQTGSVVEAARQRVEMSDHLICAFQDTGNGFVEEPNDSIKY